MICVCCVWVGWVVFGFRFAVVVGVRVGLRLCFRLFVLYLVGCRLVVWALLSGSFWWIVCGCIGLRWLGVWLVGWLLVPAARWLTC